MFCLRSVIPLFKKQIREGGPITITHKKIIRYFMTLQSAQLVLHVAGISDEGSISLTWANLYYSVFG